jgi:4-(gamma-glutamylamino)butanal dehydrogenase
MDHADWVSEAAKLTPPTKAFIDGDFVAAKSGETFADVNPATGAVTAQVAECRDADVDLAVVAARTAFEDGRWSRLAIGERKKRLLTLAELIRSRATELALCDTLDIGRPISDTHGYDVPATADCFAWYAEALDKMYDEVAPVPPGNTATIRRTPLGVVGAVVPWNFPLDIAGWKLAPALAAGNSVVLKPAEQSPLSALLLAELAAEAGIPDGVLNVVPGFGETAGQALGRHPDVDVVVFTGSTEVGKRFLTYAGESNLKQVWLECGGKSPVVVFDDADLDGAAELAAFGFCANAGQVCSATTRLILHDSVAEDFLARLTQAVAAWAPGDPLDPATRLGPMVDVEAATAVHRAVEATTGQVILGGSRTGAYLDPTIVTGLRPGDHLVEEELFGPVLSVLTFGTEAQAVTLANATRYGLAASLWTRDLARAHRVSDDIQAGTISINTVDALSVTTPFGGFKQSGFGRDLSLHSFDKYTGLKTVWTSYR